MTMDNVRRDANGQDRRGSDEGIQLARLTAREFRRAPGAPYAWARFLVARAFWILAVTAATIGGAAALVYSQTPLYRSAAEVAVEPPEAAASSGNPPNMATEEGVVSSGAVLARASRLLGVPVATLASDVSAHVPGTTTLLQITYADPDPRVAQQRAQAIAQAYVSYRSAKPAAVRGKAPANAAAASATPTAVLVTPASLPTSPAVPNRLFDMGVAVIVGLALGIGAGGLRDYLDDRLRGPLDLEARAGAPVLALIPAYQSRRRDRGAGLVTVTRPGSLVAEAYRGLRAQLVQMATSRNAKTLLVTSPGWEDKSTVAANLAATLAQSFRSVVLVGGDLRWGRAQELFAGGNEDGHGGLLDGRASPAEALRLTGVPGLRLLPPGAVPANPLLEHPAWQAALNDIRRHADLVVVEGPPLVASADARPLTELAEMILVVADARRTTRAQLRAAMREVEHDRGKLAGFVLADVGRRHPPRSRRAEPPGGDARLAGWWRPAARPDASGVVDPDLDAARAR
jgi:polysaccharide biosynthesis transport protein